MAGEREEPLSWCDFKDFVRSGDFVAPRDRLARVSNIRRIFAGFDNNPRVSYERKYCVTQGLEKRNIGTESEYSQAEQPSFLIRHPCFCPR
jgi:hypothetical protein